MNLPSRYRFRSSMPVGPGELWAWHARPGAFERLTPPWEPVSLVHRTGERLENGLRVTLGVGPPPLRLRWVAEHRDCRPGEGFRDVQISGPFALWDHHHRMWEDAPGRSILEDDLSVALPLHRLVRRVAEPWLRRKLERLFAYRHAVTLGDLEAHAAHRGRPLRIGVDGSGVAARALRHFLTTGGHAVTPAGTDDPAPPAAVVLVGPGPGEAGPSLEARIARLAETPAPACLVVAGETMPPELPPAGRRVALHLGALVWPGVGWLRWARPLPGAARRGSAAPRRWIALDDALGAVLAAIRDERWEGPIDASHPEPESDARLYALLARDAPRLRLPGRPPPVRPGPRAPDLAAMGYRFRHPTLAHALDHALGRTRGTLEGPRA